MRRRLICLLLPAVAAAFLVAVTETGASAASGLTIKSTAVAVQAPNSAGNHKVLVKATCQGSKTCKGYATIFPQRNFYKWPYSIPAGKTSHITVYWLSGQDNPTGVGNAGLKKQIRLYQTGLSIVDKDISLEPRVGYHDITGSVEGSGAGLSDLKVSLWKYSGLRSERIQTKAVSGGKFTLGPVKLGINNENTVPYKISISAKVDGFRHEWFWRGDSTGNSGDTNGGGKSLGEGTGVVVRKYNDFKANFKHGAISGRLTNGGDREVRALAPPRVRPTKVEDLRDLDVAHCANEFASTTSASNGDYELKFLPRSDYDDPRYMVGYSAKGDNPEGFIGASEKQYSSCNAVLQYTYADGDDDLYSVGDPTTVNSNVADDSDRAIQVYNASGETLGAQDTYTSLRHYVPGTKILDAPFVTAVHSNSSGYSGFANLRPGKYWVERARRVQCSAWYPSLYKDNYAYHKGDRVGERWKTVNGSQYEYWDSVVHGFPQNGRAVPKGYKGWMYRDVCRTNNRGHYELVNVMNVSANTANNREVRATVQNGATISGKVSRGGGKSNKEILVSAYSTGGVLVMRSAYTSSKGTFVIRGLDSGNYRILVNGDSWRGNNNSHSGTQTKKVTAGKSYSVGTLKFKG